MVNDTHYMPFYAFLCLSVPFYTFLCFFSRLLFYAFLCLSMILRVRWLSCRKMCSRLANLLSPGPGSGSLERAPWSLETSFVQSQDFKREGRISCNWSLDSWKTISKNELWHLLPWSCSENLGSCKLLHLSQASTYDRRSVTSNRWCCAAGK